MEASSFFDSLERERGKENADRLDNWFTYHAPTPEQVVAYKELRDRGRALADAILRLTPVSADQMAAVRKVREAVMTANAAIACGGR